MTPLLPNNEVARLRALYNYAILDTDAEEAYDDIVKVASFIAGTPIALVSLVDHDRQWFKAKIGLDAVQTPRDLAFCAHAILDPDEPLNVPDAAKDERFSDNPLVTGEPKIRFYFGVPLTTSAHVAIGTLCVIDRVPRQLSKEQMEALRALGRQTTAMLELRQRASDLRQAAADQMVFMDQLEAYQRELSAANARLNDDSLIDTITGIGNRVAFDKRLAEETERSKRHGSPLSLLFVDVDEFKKVSASKDAGDTILKMVANTLHTIRPSDFLARYADDRFAIIMPATDVDQACSQADRIRAALAAVSTMHGSITISAGIGTLTMGKVGDYPLVQETEKALRAAQKAGRNRVIHADLVKEMTNQSYIIL